MATSTDAFKLSVLASILAQGNVLSLHSGDPGTTGANEISGGSYARKTFSWPAAAIVGGAAVSAAVAQQMNVPGGVAVTHYGIYDSSGVFQYGKALNPGATLNAAGVIDVTPSHTYSGPQ
uniref:Minor tail protein n=1 Tax=Mycobacterium phage Pharb TaxID=3136626 RepID=A0AAU8GNW2_9VIRU